MCGIVGYTGHQPALPLLIAGLRDLEYRGYDSAGVATMDTTGAIHVVKRAGKITRLEDALQGDEHATYASGIGHTRWATHGKPNDVNAHPHSGPLGRAVVVHNGIVENYSDLRARLLAQGNTFTSETDTEIIAHLVEEALATGAGLLDAVRAAADRLDGAQAIVAMDREEPGTLVAARLGNAGGVVVGIGDDEMFVASDLAAVLPHTQRIIFLNDHHFARISSGGVSVVDAAGAPVEADERRIAIDPMSAIKGDYPHFMIKEIMEQPAALADTVQSLVSIEPADVRLTDFHLSPAQLQSIQRVVLIAMGTSLHAAMVGRSYIERFAGIPAEVDNASEFRYREPVLDSRTLVVSVSQSGESVDVLEAMALARESGALLATICNTEGAQTTRVSDGCVYTRAGLERGVASTKCFTTALVALYALAQGIGAARGNDRASDIEARVRALVPLPELTAGILEGSAALQSIALQLANASHMLVLGRGMTYPIALEGALKMKEVSYVHAEGYAAGEMKHGPIALISPGFPAVVIATKHAMRSKMISNIEQLRARGASVIAIATEGDDEIQGIADATIFIPDVEPEIEPILASVPLQLLAYQVGVTRGCDVDQPRNLAKTVTVE